MDGAERGRNRSLFVDLAVNTIGTSSIGAAAGVLTMFAFLSNPGGWVIGGVLISAAIAGSAAGLSAAAGAKCGAFGPHGNNG